MSFRQLIFRNLAYHWRTNLAVICGVIAATAVIGGALVVGDSVRASLRQMSLDRLGHVDHALAGTRFFREALAADLQAVLPAGEQLTIAPLLVIQGTVEHKRDETQVNRAGQIQVYGLDERCWSLLDHRALTVPRQGEMVVNRRVADELQAKVGDRVSLVVEIPSAIPRDSLLGERNETVIELTATITGIAEEESGLARLGLNPSQQLPPNVFVSLPDLQTLIGLQAVPRSRSNPFAKPARVNALFCGDPRSTSLALDRIGPDAARSLSDQIARLVTLEDLSLRLLDSDHGYVTLECEQMFLPPEISSAALETASGMNLRTSPVLVYLFNEIWKSGNPEKYSMYSVVAGIDPQAAAPFGPFEFVGEHQPLEGNGAWLNDWVAADLNAQVGDTVRVKYHVVGDRGDLPEDELELKVAGIVKLAGPANDTGYTPTVPGVTDVRSYDEWKEPFPLKRERVTDRDDEYLDQYRTTPKVFVSLAHAKQLWTSRYGDVTTIRLAPRDGQTLEQLHSEFGPALLSHLQPRELGLTVQPVKLIGLMAAQGTTDFTGLFIGFSFFLILSATILVGLLFRLGVERRLSEIGLLSAVGLTPAQVRRLLLLEGALLVGMGGLLGTLAAVGYAGVMIHGLKTWWNRAIGTRFLFLSAQPASLATGFGIAVIVALIAVWWALRRTRGISTRQLLSGDTETAAAKPSSWSTRTVAVALIGGSLLAAALAILRIIPDSEAFGGFSWRVVLFFLVGMGMLTGSLAALAAALGSTGAAPIVTPGWRSESRLSWRNAARNRSRSVLTASLLASATFVIVAVGAGQQNPAGTAPNPRSGNGGFTLVAETNVPVLYDLNTRAGRVKLGFDVNSPQVTAVLETARVIPFRMRPGENASCLNLYQTTLPTVLGVPDDVLEQLIAENRFTFADTPGDHPWELLRNDLPDARIPVLGDMNTLMYSLHKGIGATINVPSDENPQHKLQVRGMFANSIFQGVLVMSEANFKKVFPDQAGFRYFLIETPPADAPAVSQLLESQLGDYGLDAELVSDRLADFLAVQNTYLSTFQTLGGLGLLLGTLGLTTVMLRNVLERRSELALLRAVGFGGGQVARLVLWENALLLLCGLACGGGSALLAMSPHLLTSAADVPWGSLAGLLGGVLVLGMLAALAAVRAAVRLPILETLRGE